MQTKEKLFHREALTEAFQFFDRDGTGYLEKEEIEGILKGGDAEEVECVIKELDTDGDQRISKEEFIDYLMGQTFSQISSGRTI